MSRLKRTMGRSVAVLMAVLVTSVAFVGGCSDDEPQSSDKDPDGVGESATADRPITTKATVGRVYGELREAQKLQMKSEVTAVIDEFFEGAYLGEYPRDSFDAAYASFTDGAREDAARDAALLSNADIADQIDEATGVRRRVALDVLAVKGKPKGVTAEFVLIFDTAGSLESTQKVKGTLLLDHQPAGWRIFGYDVDRSVTP